MFRTGEKQPSRLSALLFHRRSVIQPLTHWDLPLPPDIMTLILDTYLEITTIITLSQTFPALQPYCYSKLFRHLKISSIAGRNHLTFRFLSHVIRECPYVLERVESLTLEGQFDRKHLTSSSYVLSRISKRSHNLACLHLSHLQTPWHRLDRTLRKHILTLLSRGSLKTVDLYLYRIPVNLLCDLPDLKLLEADCSPGYPTSGIPPGKRKVRVEELRFSGTEMQHLLHPNSPFDFSALKVLELHNVPEPNIQKIFALSSTSLENLYLAPTGHNRNLDLGVLSCVKHITLFVEIVGHRYQVSNGKYSKSYYPLPTKLNVISDILATCKSYNAIEKVYLFIGSMKLEDLGRCNWLFLDSLLGRSGTWKELKEVLIVRFQSPHNGNAITPNCLEPVEPIEMPRLEGRGCAVNWYNNVRR